MRHEVADFANVMDVADIAEKVGNVGITYTGIACELKTAYMYISKLCSPQIVLITVCWI